MLQPAAELSRAAAALTVAPCTETAPILSPSLEPNPAQEARELVQAPSGCLQELPRKPSLFLTFPELPSAAGPTQHPALRGGARLMSTAASSRAWGTGSKRCHEQKTQPFFFFSTFPCLFPFSQFLLKENFQLVLKTTKFRQNNSPHNC